LTKMFGGFNMYELKKDSLGDAVSSRGGVLGSLREVYYSALSETLVGYSKMFDGVGNDARNAVVYVGRAAKHIGDLLGGDNNFSGGVPALVTGVLGEGRYIADQVDPHGYATSGSDKNCLYAKREKNGRKKTSRHPPRNSARENRLGSSRNLRMS
jgi:hypothetical protein